MTEAIYPGGFRPGQSVEIIHAGLVSGTIATVMNPDEAMNFWEQARSADAEPDLSRSVPIAFDVFGRPVKMFIDAWQLKGSIIDPPVGP